MSTASVPSETAGSGFVAMFRRLLIDRGAATVRTDPVSLAMSAAVLSTVGYSGLMMTVARGGEGFAWATVPLAVIAYFVTEKSARFGYTPLAANVLSIPLLFNATGTLFRGDVADRLVGGGDLLTTLAWVMLFQWKEPRHYLWLCALAVLQAAVGAVLTTEVGFGAMIPLLLFLTVRAVMHFVATRSTRGDASRRRGRSSRSSGTEDVAQTLVRPSVIASDPGLSASEFPRHGRAFGRTAMIVSFGAASTALFLFALTPRLWIERATIEDRAAAALGSSLGGGRAAMPKAVSGVSETVELGSMSEILSSNEVAFDIRVVEPDGDALDVEEYTTSIGLREPLFRGGVMNDYEGGRWTLLSPPGADKRRVPLRRSPPPDIEFQFVRQEVRIKAAAAKTVYAIDPAFFVSPERPARGVAATYEPLTRTLRYEVARDANAATTEWSVYSPAGVDLADRVRSRVFSGGPGETRLWRDERRQCLELPPDGLRRLKRLARRVGAADGTDGPDASAVVERLMSYLSGSGEYSYSIDAHVVPEGIDPVEHFLLDRKEGHCEYFASALALMLRANGVPARLVNGYKGGELNSLSGYYEVEQRHAHAWVEAEVDGRWRTLDPTPSDRRDAVVAANGSTFGLFDDAVSYVTDIWDQYFVLLNLKTQERLFYNPFSTAVASAGAGLGELGESEETASAVGFFAALGRPTEWFAWRGGVIGYAMLAALTVVVVSVLRVRRSGSVAGVRGAASGSSAVAFFERYRSICRDAGLDRPAQATEREFGSVVGDAFDDVATAGRGDGVLRRIIAAFYEARFGGKPLAAERLSTLDEDVHFVGKGLASRMPKDAAAKVR